MKILYDILFFFFALAYLPAFFLKGKHRAGFAERFGFVPKAARESLAGKRPIWVHGVSVGEAVLALRLAQDLRTRFPNHPVLFTTTTPAGREVFLKSKHEGDFVFYLPIDLSFCIARFFGAVRPLAIIVLETEIWPNLVWRAEREGVPIWIANGRLSDRAFKKYLGFRTLMKPVLRRFTEIGVQNERMRERFVRLGADGRKVCVTGNMKFDWRPRTTEDPLVARALARMHADTLFWWVAGSTHEGEEEILFQAYQSLRPSCPKLRLLIAPRHLQRLSAIERLASDRRIPLKKVSSFGSNGYDDSRQDDAVLLVDSMGALASFYEVCGAAFVGGSLVPVGGHNPVEPAYFGRPVLFGPHMQNFAEIARAFVDGAAACQAADAAELQQRIAEWIADPKKASERGAAAKALVQQNQGAVEQSLHMLEKVLLR